MRTGPGTLPIVVSLLLLAGCGGIEADDAFDDVGTSELGLVKPRVLGAIVVGEARTGALIGTTPDGWTFDLAHLRRVEFRVETTQTGFSPLLQIFGPLRGTTVPATPFFSTVPGARVAFEGQALPATGRYVVAIVCTATSAKCRGKKYTLIANWGVEPESLATLVFGRATVTGEALNGALLRGRPVVVQYDATRFSLNAANANVADPPCRMIPTLHWRQRAGEPFASYLLEAAGPAMNQRDALSAVLPLRADAQLLEVYFDGVQAGRACANPSPLPWDSDLGAKWTWPVSDATLVFSPVGAPKLVGTVRRGGTLAISYPLQRMYWMLSCRPAYSGFNLTTIDLFWRFDGGAFHQETVARPYNLNDPRPVGPFAPVLQVPAGSRELEIYLHGWAPGCEQWDSDYGRNFHIALP